jgi:uncharacterized protein (TIGR03067 family)
MNKALACCIVLAVALLAGADDARDKAVKEELEKLSGRWQAVSVVRDGKELDKLPTEMNVLIVKGEKYTFADDLFEVAEGTHTLDPSKTPKELDAVRSKGKGKGEKILGIYELTKDTFKVCLAPPGKERPKEFASKAGSGYRLLVFKRTKD